MSAVVDRRASAYEQAYQGLTYAERAGWLVFRHVVPGRPHRYLIEVGGQGRLLALDEVVPYLTCLADLHDESGSFPASDAPQHPDPARDALAEAAALRRLTFEDIRPAEDVRPGDQAAHLYRVSMMGASRVLRSDEVMAYLTALADFRREGDRFPATQVVSAP